MKIKEMIEVSDENHLTPTNLDFDSFLERRFSKSD
jgi:hypothetical protein